MLKRDVVDAVAEKMSGYMKKDIAQSVDIILETMAQGLSRQRRIEIRGFGSFVIKRYDSYEGRNPKTGKKIKVKPKKLPFFKVGKDLREQVNQKR